MSYFPRCSVNFWSSTSRKRWLLCLFLCACSEDETFVPGGGNLTDTVDSQGGDGAVGTIIPGDFEATFDVTTLFDMEKLLAPEGINLQVKKDVIRWSESDQAWLVPFAFRSQIWHGNAWDHPSLLYVPKVLNPAFSGSVAFIQQGTSDLDPGLSMDFDFGAKTAAILGVPVAVLAKIPHPTMFSDQEAPDLAEQFPDCFGVSLVENELESCGNRLVLASEQVKWSLQIAIVRAQIRAITAVSLISEKLEAIGMTDIPEITVQKAIVGAGGKRGRVLWLAAVVDDRISGTWNAAADMANLIPFYQNMAGVWSSAYPFGDPQKQIEFLSTGFGKDWRSIIDPFGYMEKRPDLETMIVAGTNDALYPVGSYQLYDKRLPSDWRLLHVPNYGHGIASEQHLHAWRMFIARVAGNRPIFRPMTTYEAQSDSVNVGVVLTGNQADALSTQNVVVHYTASQVMKDDRDLRDAIWDQSTMQSVGVDEAGQPRFSGTFPVTVEYWGAYVTVEEKDSAGLVGMSSSAVRLSWE